MEELRTTRIVETQTPPKEPYPSLSRLVVCVKNNDALRGLAAFLPLCPLLTTLNISSLDATAPDFSTSLLTSTLLSLPSALSSLSLKMNHESSLGGILSPPILDSVLHELTGLAGLTRLELASHGFSAFDFIHKLSSLEELSLVHVQDEMRALVPWDLEALATELVLLGAGRRLVVQILVRGKGYQLRASEARDSMKVVRNTVARIEVWVGVEGGDEERRVYPSGAEWT